MGKKNTDFFQNAAIAVMYALGAKGKMNFDDLNDADERFDLSMKELENQINLQKNDIREIKAKGNNSVEIKGMDTNLTALKSGLEEAKKQFKIDINNAKMGSQGKDTGLLNKKINLLAGILIHLGVPIDYFPSAFDKDPDEPDFTDLGKFVNEQRLNEAIEAAKLSPPDEIRSLTEKFQSFGATLENKPWIEAFEARVAALENKPWIEAFEARVAALENKPPLDNINDIEKRVQHLVSKLDQIGIPVVAEHERIANKLPTDIPISIQARVESTEAKVEHLVSKLDKIGIPIVADYERIANELPTDIPRSIIARVEALESTISEFSRASKRPSSDGGSSVRRQRTNQTARQSSPIKRDLTPARHTRNRRNKLWAVKQTARILGIQNILNLPPSRQQRKVLNLPEIREPVLRELAKSKLALRDIH